MRAFARLRDRLLRWRVARVLKRYPYPLHCEVKDAVAFLYGSVDSYERYVEVGLRVGSIRGLDGVVNEIEYPGKPREERKAAAAPSVFLGEYDVVVVGAGIVGSMIARELSKYELRVALVEKNVDAAMGVTKANNGLVHSGVEEPLGKVKTRLCALGNGMYDELAKELKVKFVRVGALWLLTPRSLPKLKGKLPAPLLTFLLRFILPEAVRLKALALGVRGVRVIRDPKKVKSMEPCVCDDVVAAVYVPSVGIVDPYEVAIALVENAVDNGVETYFGAEVLGFEKEGDRVVGVVTSKGVLKTRFVINAAGLYADEIAELAGSKEYTIHPRKGVLLVFDKESSSRIRHEVAEIELPRHPRTKGGGVNPTVSGNVVWGPTALEVCDKGDTSVSHEDVELILSKFKRALPHFDGKVIRVFAGLRPATFTEDFVIRPAKWVRGFIHVAGIQSPGVAAAPAIAKLVVEILRREGLALKPKSGFKAERGHAPRFSELSLEERDRLVSRDPRWGRVVCQCELVTEAEVVDAIERIRKIGGVPTLDGVKLRTRAMMGDCQGAFCRLRVASLVARECGVEVWRVTVRGPGTEIGVGDVKALLAGGGEEGG